MKSELIRVHHNQYLDDIPFWIRSLEGLDPIMEIGCGHGRVTLPLLGSGHQVLGVDSDSTPLAFLGKAIANLREEDRARITLEAGDILEFDSTELFGGVIIPCNTYSTFSANDRLRLLGKAYGWLQKGGLFIAGMPNPTRMEEIFEESVQQLAADTPDQEGVITHPVTGNPVLVSSRVRDGGNSLFWDWLYDHLRPDGEVERLVATVEHFRASSDQILEELQQAGFGEVIRLGDYSGEGYQTDSPYLIVVCRR